jgi:hypothetical protein
MLQRIGTDDIGKHLLQLGGWHPNNICQILAYEEVAAKYQTPGGVARDMDQPRAQNLSRGGPMRFKPCATADAQQ